MENLVSGDLTILVSQTAAGATKLDWIGKSCERKPGTILTPFFQEVVEHAENAASAIVMHFDRLDHFNSSTIKTVIQFIRLVNQKNLRMTIIYDNDKRWQKLSFDALRIFETEDGCITFQPIN